ncbi:MAG: DMT family transporter [Syntrophomonadaceae bacterium]|jgi:transporter family-2 protein|nr:DMT family transporter [Syntrophomonadaceae bacterium]
MNWLFLALAALAGSAMAIQGTWNAALGKILGIWQSTLLVHVIGTVTVLLIILFLGISFGSFSKIGSVPYYALLGGVLNVIIIFAVVKVIPSVGVGNATTAIIVAQISTAVLIDCMGAFGMKKISFQYLDILGIVLLAVGARILLMK